MNGLEAGYLRTVGDDRRRDLGQFFTHPKIARFMARWVMESPNRGMHDPAFGLGAFLDAADEMGGGSPFTGSEIDAGVLDYWREFSPMRGKARVYAEDYLAAWGRGYGNIVCNPPYMRFQKFANRDAVLKRMERELGARLSGYTNMASAFLLKSLSELAPGGRLAYIMPPEFLNTGYGTAVKRRLIDGAHLAAIVRLDCEKDAFPDAITSACVILYDSARRFSRLNLYAVKSLDALESLWDAPAVAEIPYVRLDPSEKWLPHFEKDPPTISAAAVPLAYYGRFIRGIATGANDFFALKPSRAAELGLDESETTTCVSKSAQIRTPFFTAADRDRLAARDERALLFDVNGRRPSDAARAYIRMGEALGYDQRYITRNRRPWYSLERRAPSPILIGVFSRGGYKIARNETRALNLTCFHGFRPNALGERYVDGLFLYLSSAVGRKIVSLSARMYGDSLTKFEPNDLNAALAPSPQTLEDLPPERAAAALEYMRRHTGAVPEYVERRFALGMGQES